MVKVRITGYRIDEEFVEVRYQRMDTELYGVVPIQWDGKTFTREMVVNAIRRSLAKTNADIIAHDVLRPMLDGGVEIS